MKKKSSLTRRQFMGRMGVAGCGVMLALGRAPLSAQIPRRCASDTSGTYTITEDCVCCGACLPECPTEAISEGEDIYTIDAEKCTGCGECLQYCPVEAIQEREEGKRRFR